MELKLFALSGAADLGQAVAAHLGVPLAAHEEREFEDGEHKARPLEDVSDRDVYVLQGLHGDAGGPASERLLRMLFFLATLRDAGAARVTAVLPYLAYARKDRRTKSRDPVTTRYVAQLLEAVGTDRVVAMDVHNLAAFENAFRCPTVHLEARPLFVTRLLGLLGGRLPAVVSPDAGGYKRAERLRESLTDAFGEEPPMVFLEKKRSGGVVSGDAVVGDVAGRPAVIVDDLVSTGGTLVRAARACRERGATAVYACVTHGLFVADADSTLADGSLDRFLVTNSVPQGRNAVPQLGRRLSVVDCAPLVGEALRRLNEGGSVVDLIEQGPAAPRSV